jgi:hypothetical protein
MIKLKRIKKIYLFSLFIVLFIVVLFLGYGAQINQLYQGRAWSIEQVISEYIQENAGQFPKSQQDLISKGYLKVEYEKGNPRYFNKIVYNDQRTEWQEWPVHLEWFTVRYGVQKEDFLVVNGRLCEKENGQEVFLLDGPYNRRIEPTLRRMYRMISLKWYKQMGENEVRE